jgi:hypothetical protein
VRANIGDGAWARLSALSVVLLLAVLVGAAIAGRPKPPPPGPTLNAIAEAVAEATPTASPIAQPTRPSQHHKIAGDDGIFGMPGYPWRGTKATDTQSRHVFIYRTRAPAGWVTR